LKGQKIVKQIILLVYLVVISYGEESFISKDEYAAGLYHNPRGIGCNHCHGEKGEGELVANYKDRGKYRAFAAPSIQHIDFQTLYAKLNKRVKGMPRYYLTREEIEILFYYLQSVQKKSKQ